MNRLVIVDDKLDNGLRLAEQLQNWLVQENLVKEIELDQIFLFKQTEEEVSTAKEEYRQKISELGLNVEPICLWNFDEKLDECMENIEEKTIFLVDYMLFGDGSDGVPEYRVNIRYARRQDTERKEKLFFYTLTGAENDELLCELVGEEHVIHFIFYEGVCFETPIEVRRSPMTEEGLREYVHEQYFEEYWDSAFEEEKNRLIDGYLYDIDYPQCLPFLPSEIEDIYPITEREYLKTVIEEWNNCDSLSSTEGGKI